jgi:ferredoxin
MKAKVDPDICIGCGLCVSTCPDVFRMQDDKAVVFVDTVPPNAQDSCRKAQEECPVAAIEVKG